MDKPKEDYDTWCKNTHELIEVGFFYDRFLSACKASP